MSAHISEKTTLSATIVVGIATVVIAAYHAVEPTFARVEAHHQRIEHHKKQIESLEAKQDDYIKHIIDISTSLSRIEGRLEQIDKN